MRKLSPDSYTKLTVFIIGNKFVKMQPFFGSVFKPYKCSLSTSKERAFLYSLN